ncbi:MAG: hypothetical protein QHH19_06350, partial [Candidatus Thermoplasmatota archaeon]|nr:hypothetical protein [Candidatus Thermoplasmatota archaeon]
TYLSSEPQSLTEILNGTIKTKNVRIKDYQNNTLEWDFFNFSGQYLWSSTKISSETLSNSRIESIKGTLELRNAYLDLNDGKIRHVDLISLSGDYILTYNHTYDLLIFDGDATFEILNLSTPSLSLKSLYLCLNGDITLKTWKNDYYDNQIVFESQNGFTIERLSIERYKKYFPFVDIINIEGTSGPGYLHLGGYPESDSYVFIDSSEIDYIDLIFTFTNTTNNRGIRFSLSSNDFDADVFLLQWDTVTLDLPNLRAIPYNWYKTGSTSGETDIDIDIIIGNKIYNLWPLEYSGNSNEETENTEEETNYNNGYEMEPLGNSMPPPNKPQKPKGPTGGIVIGRIVKGHSYTFTTTTNGNGQYIAYNWSWGDGTYSGWSPFIKSGIGVTGSHTWNPGTCPKTYQIKVKAKNINGEESEWSESLTITVRENFLDDGQNNYQNDELVEQSQNNYCQEQNQDNNQGQPNNS